MQVNPVVFGVSAGLVVLFSAFGALAPERASELFGALQGWIVDRFGWFYMMTVTGFLVFAVALALSPYGAVKLGPDDAVPEFGYRAWFAMLFSAGIGIGLMFFGVAEPMIHFSAPPGDTAPAGTVAAAREAMRITFFHWGLHGWGVYVVTGLALAYFGFRRNLPLTIRSALYPVIGERIHGPIGDAVDVLAVLGTLFGVATSLGLGVLQLTAGLDYLFGVGRSVPVQLALVGGITALATVSVVAGLDAGIRRLSELNMALAVALLAFVLVAGPTVFLLQAFLQNTGSYLSQLVALSFRQFARAPDAWMGDWTLFYWGWWLAWAPFVGMFIARISRGRTIREFVFGVLGVPSLFIFLWMTVFGDTAIRSVLLGEGDALLSLVQDNLPLALFAFLEDFPLSTVTALLSIVLVVVFFVTSADSGSLVIDMIASGGAADPPVWQRVFWALVQGLVGAVLLVAGGLGALRTAALASGLPFALVLLLVCVGLWTSLRREREERLRLDGPSLPVARDDAPWRERLAQLVRHHDRATALRWLAETARPALESFATELQRHGARAHVEVGSEAIALHVGDDGWASFGYGIALRSYGATEAESAGPAPPARHWCAEAWTQPGDARYDMLGASEQAVLDDLLAHYSRWLAARAEPLDGGAAEPGVRR
jgi:choline/glycine/proline betaine transport protein